LLLALRGAKGPIGQILRDAWDVQDERLKSLALPVRDLIRDHDPVSGECRVYPDHGVALVVTDENGCEAAFGFFRFPLRILDQTERPCRQRPSWKRGGSATLWTRQTRASDNLSRNAKRVAI